MELVPSLISVVIMDSLLTFLPKVRVQNNIPRSEVISWPTEALANLFIMDNPNTTQGGHSFLTLWFPTVKYLPHAFSLHNSIRLWVPLQRLVLFPGQSKHRRCPGPSRPSRRSRPF